MWWAPIDRYWHAHGIADCTVIRMRYATAPLCCRIVFLVAAQNPRSMTLEQQKDILDYTYDLLTRFNHGVPPKGSVAPWWETSADGTALLLDKGIEYGT